MLLIQYTLIFASVLALVALGGMFAERSGVINLGLEGIMVIGALAGAIVSAVLTKANASVFLNVIISIFASMVSGCFFSMLLGVACITFKADQTLVGTALNIMSTALAVVVARMYTSTPSSEIAYISSMFKINLDIKFSYLIAIFIVVMIGTLVIILNIKKTKKLRTNIYTIVKKAQKEEKMFSIIFFIKILFVLAIAIAFILHIRNSFSNSLNFNLEISYFLLLMLLIVVVSYIFLFKTKFGLRLMACGEHPQSAGSVGINVYFQRYLGVSISGILGGLGGFAYIVQSAGCWDFKYGVAGFGFLALAVMIFGQWKPIKIFLSALIFGLCQTISVLYSGKWGIPQFIYKMLPYIVCMVVLVLTSRKSRAPKAEGIPYDKSQR